MTAEEREKQAEAEKIHQEAVDRIRLEYEWAKRGHDHEWTILVSRISAYLASQALFATGAVILKNANEVVVKNAGQIVSASTAGKNDYSIFL